MATPAAANTMQGGPALIVLNSGEKEDLKQPLPAEWTEPKHLGEVTIYNGMVSPPCCKLRTIFLYYKVPMKVIKGKKKDSEYKKMPVVVINNQFQINDSYVVVKNLARILDGQELSPELLAVEEMTTFGLMMALEVAAAGSCTALYRCGCLMGGVIGCVLSSCSCLLCCIAPGLIKSRHPDLKDLPSYAASYTMELGIKKFFHGEKAGIVDFSICGVIAPFAQSGNWAVVNQFLGTSGPLRDWYERMKPSLPNIF